MAQQLLTRGLGQAVSSQLQAHRSALEPQFCSLHRPARVVRDRVRPSATYRGYYGNPQGGRNWWRNTASGFMNSTLSELLEQLERDFGVTVEGGAAATASPKAAAEGFSTPVDRIETDDDVTYFVDVPGLEKNQVKIQVNQQDRTLTVSGERFQPVPVEEPAPAARHINKFERRFGKFSRTVTLPETADTQLISAKVDKGVLRIKVLKQIKPSPEIQEVEID